MTELFGPAQVHDRAGSGSSNEGVIPRYALLSFQRPCRQKRRVSPPRRPAWNTKKAPRRGARLWERPGPGRSGLLLRGCSLRDPKQERPRSIARLRREVHLGPTHAPEESNRLQIQTFHEHGSLAGRRGDGFEAPLARL